MFGLFFDINIRFFFFRRFRFMWIKVIRKILLFINLMVMMLFFNNISNYISFYRYIL